MYTHKISYTKNILTGNLAGVSVEETLRTTADALPLHMIALKKTNKKFSISNVTVEKT